MPSARSNSLILKSKTTKPFVGLSEFAHLGLRQIRFVVYFLCLFSGSFYGQTTKSKIQNDSLTLAQAYINLTLMGEFFENLEQERISKILPFEKSELASISDKKFIAKNSKLYNFTYSLWYFNKVNFHYMSVNDAGSKVLMEWKNLLGQSINHYNISKTDSNLKYDPFYDLIQFDLLKQDTLKASIINLKEQFTPQFNEDVYPSFKRIFYKAKESGVIDLRQLLSEAKVYNLEMSLSILRNKEIPKEMLPFDHVSPMYQMDEELELISKYLQLKYLANRDEIKTKKRIDKKRLYIDYKNFIQMLENKDYDSFIETELNIEVCDVLYNELQNKFAFDDFAQNETRSLTSRNRKRIKRRRVKTKGSEGRLKDIVEETKTIVFAKFESQTQYFFPDPAPKPSAKLFGSNYKPGAQELGEIDNVMSTVLKSEGYGGQLHYYYCMDGFALTTSLEKFNVDGTPIESDKRWVRNMGSDGKFSYYEIFKSLFFDLESEFRMFTFIIASKNLSIGDDNLSAGMAQELIKNSYPILPDTLKNKSLARKNLSVLVYHFHQNDVGEVPMLNTNDSISALEHLRKAGLENLIIE